MSYSDPAEIVGGGGAQTLEEQTGSSSAFVPFARESEIWAFAYFLSSLRIVHTFISGSDAIIKPCQSGRETERTTSFPKEYLDGFTGPKRSLTGSGEQWNSEPT